MTDAIKPPRIFIACPCYGEIAPAFVESLLHLTQHLARLGVAHEVRFLPGESLITRARNRLTRDFLAEPAFTHILWLDCDLAFPPSTVIRLISSGHTICAAPYAKKAIGAGLVGNPVYENQREVDGKLAGEPITKDGWAKANDVGTGCMLIARGAFEALIAAKRDDGEPVMVPYTCDLTGFATYPFFDCGPENGRDPKSRYLSEDYFACRLFQHIGGFDIWVDIHAKIQHVGRFAFQSKSFAEMWRGEVAA